jgi:serine/threonine protein phosphatase PrpC
MSNFDDDTEPIPIQQIDTAPERPYSPPVRVVAAGLSHKGNVREENEDHYLVARVGRSLDTLVTSLPEGEVPERFDETGFALMVADGMGGAAAGEVASRVAISTLVNIVLDVPDWIMKLDERVADKLMSRAVEYYRKVDTTLADLVKADPELQGMGTTMTVGYSIGRDLFVSHVGDSRAYLFRDKKLKQLTRDHTHVQELVDAGMITREEAATHRLRHVLTNAIGGRDRAIDVDVQRVRLKDGDRLLFCTDGLTEVVRDDDIADVLGRSKAPEVVCRSLVDLALERGGPDNVTVVAARFGIAG